MISQFATLPGALLLAVAIVLVALLLIQEIHMSRGKKR